jgi:hypothetical protein
MLTNALDASTKTTRGIMKEYSIEQLEKTFGENSIQYREERLERIEKFKEHYPNDHVPAYILEDFDISKAFQTICQEIIKLKEHGKS